MGSMKRRIAMPKNCGCLYFFVVTMVFSAACAEPETQSVVLTPPMVTSFGHVPVTLTSDRLFFGKDELDAYVPVAVSVGGHAAYDIVVINDTTVRFTVQSVAAGDNDVVVTTDAPVTFAGALYAQGPADHRLDRVVAMGASITMGTESMTVNTDSQLNSPAADFARAASAYFPMPLIKNGALRGIQLDNFDANCNQLGAIDSIDLDEALDSLYVEERDDYFLYAARVDPYASLHNLAIGGARVHELIDGYTSQSKLLALIATDPMLTVDEMLIYDAKTQLELLEHLGPSLILMFDLLGNDFTVGLFSDMDPNRMPTNTEMEILLTRLFDRLTALGAPIFLADMPPLPMAPQIAAEIDRLVFEEGEERAEVEARFALIQDRVPEMNDVLAKVAARYDDIHVLDFYGFAKGFVDAGGLQVGDEFLGLGPLEGIFSLDGLHLTRTVNAIVANRMITLVNQTLGTHIGEVDVLAVMKNDPLAPAQLRARGYHCVGG
jgi:GDSL-like Lipase/Acylhydrolase